MTAADTCAKPCLTNCWEAVVLSSNTSTTIVLWSFRLNEFLNSPFGIAGRNMALPEFYICVHTCGEDHSTEWVFRLCFGLCI